MINNILFYLLMFSDYTIGPLSISDYALLILIIKGLIYKPVITFPYNERAPIFILLIGVITSLVFNIDKSFFIMSDFVLSGGKLAIYILAIYIVPQYLVYCNVDYIKLLKRFLTVASVGGAIQIILVSAFGRSSWPLYSLGGHWFGLETETTMFNNMGMMRSRSFWSEPAHFAIFISLIFILLLFNQKSRLEKKYYVFYVVGMICANSVSGYGIMVAIFALYIVNFQNLGNVVKAIGAGVTAIIALAVLINANDYLRSRLINLFDMKDHSGVVRTVGGFHILEYLPWYGTGVGNHANFYKSLSNMSELWFSGSGEFYNVILVAIITIGYIGAIGFILFQYQIMKTDKKMFIAFMVTHFGWGKLYTTPIWVFLIIYIVLKNQRLYGGNENG